MSEAARLKDKVAVVMGASQGLGECLSPELASEGARVVLAARNQERLGTFFRTLMPELVDRRIHAKATKMRSAFTSS